MQSMLCTGKVSEVRARMFWKSKKHVPDGGTATDETAAATFDFDIDVCTLCL